MLDARFVRIGAQPATVAIFGTIQFHARGPRKASATLAGTILTVTMLLAAGGARRDVARHTFPSCEAFAGPVLALPVAEAIVGAGLLGTVFALVPGTAHTLAAAALSLPAANFLGCGVTCGARGYVAIVTSPFAFAGAHRPSRGSSALTMVAAIFCTLGQGAVVTFPVDQALAVAALQVTLTMLRTVIGAGLALATDTGETSVADTRLRRFVAVAVHAPTCAKFFGAVASTEPFVALTGAVFLASSLSTTQIFTYVESFALEFGDLDLLHIGGASRGDDVRADGRVVVFQVFQGRYDIGNGFRPSTNATQGKVDANRIYRRGRRARGSGEIGRAHV